MVNSDASHDRAARLGSRPTSARAYPSRNATSSEAADRELERRDAALGQRGGGLVDERRLAIPPWRDQEDLLPGREVGRKPVELDITTHERRRRHHLTVDEGVVGHNVK